MVENTGSEPRRRNIPDTSERAGSNFRTRSTVSLMEAVLFFQHGNGSPPRSHPPENSHASPGNFRRRQKNPLSFGMPSETTDLRFSVHIKKSSGQTNRSSSIVCSDSIASDVSPELDESLPAQKVRLQRRPTCPAEPAKPGGGNKGARGRLSPPHAFPVFCL